ncbi:MAG: hypothetical protein IPM98_11685 [Lewinellaceae bacterium]|nr:hypothetical protein [Lewinellaceae bacterium]
MQRYEHVTLLLICCLLGRIAFAQSPSLDERAFRAMSDAERYRFVHDFSFAKMDSATAHAVLNRMQDMAQQKKDCRTVLAVKYRVYTAPLNPRGTLHGWNIMFDALKDMEWRAKECGFEVEEIAGHFYHNYELFNYERLSHEKMYVVIQKTMEKMEAMDFERFSDYQPDEILYRSIQYMWDLEDYEEAFRYLSFAERVIQPTPEKQICYTLVLNHLQIYWQEQKKDYPKAIEYAQKIRHFYLHFPKDDPKEAWKSRFWQGFPLLSIAEMRLAQGDTTGVEASADAGYELTKRAEDNTDIFAYLAEYEALQVYVPIKMAFGKLDEAGRLLQRAAYIKKGMGVRWEVDVFKHIKFYENYARYHAVRGNAAEALRYTQDASVLQDSLNKRNDIRKYERIKQRLQAEKYAARLQLVESERELQKLLRNAAFIIVALMLLLMYAWFHRQRYLRHQKEVELDTARNDLAAMTNSFLEKAELVENLRLEMSKISASGAHSQYLEQLIGSTILMEGDWQRFRSVFEKVYPEFIADQKALYPGLTPGELRYLVLEKLQLSTHEMARMLGVSDNTVRQKRARFRRKGNAAPHPDPDPTPDP